MIEAATDDVPAAQELTQRLAIYDEDALLAGSREVCEEIVEITWLHCQFRGELFAKANPRYFAMFYRWRLAAS